MRGEPITDLGLLPREALDPVFGALADPVRRGLFELLCRFGAQTTAMLAERTGLSRPRVSKHVIALKYAQLVGERRVGEERFHSVRPDALVALGAWTDQVKALVRTMPDDDPERMEAPVYRTRRVVVERRMPYRAELVWRALTEPRLMAEWWLGNDFAPVLGQRFTLFADWGPIDCEVLRLVPLEMLAFRWRTQEADTIVTWKLRSPGRFPGRWTVLRLEHTGFRSNDHVFRQSAQSDWPRYLAGLEEVLARMG